MRSWTIAFSLGVMSSGMLAQLPPLALFPLLLLAALGLHCVRKLRLAGAFLLGCCYLLQAGYRGLDEQLPVALEGQDLWVQGIVWTMPQPGSDSQRLTFMVEKLCPADTAGPCDFYPQPLIHRLVQINAYENLGFFPGQRWQLQLRLKRPHGFANPGGFDYEAWLFERRIRATGYIRASPDNRLLEANSGTRQLEVLRAHVHQRLQQVGQNLRYLHLVNALGLGLRDGISDAEQDLFRSTGTSHLMVISGMHLAFVSLVLYRLAVYLWSRSAILCLYCPAQRSAAVVAMIGAWLYAALAGFSLPVVRALVMVAVMLGGRLLCRQTAATHALPLALCLVLVLDPLASQNPGFWLSFCAVGILLFCLPAGDALQMPGLLQSLRQALASQWRVSVGLLPLMLIFFGQFSLLAPLVNLPAIPYIALGIVPLVLLALILLWLWPAAATFVLVLTDKLLQYYMAALQTVVQLAPFSLLPLPTLSGLRLLFLLAVVAMILLGRSKLLRAICLLLLPVLLYWPQPQLAQGLFTVTVLDVGQGLAVMISTRNHHLLYDTGPKFSPRFDAGSDVVLPYLHQVNIRRLDSVIVSHADADHAGGLPGIAAAFPAAAYLGSDTTLFTSPLHSSACHSGQQWDWDGVHFAMLHPDPDSDARNNTRNNGSCVLLVSLGHSRVLLPGDIESPVEAQLLQQGLRGPLSLLLAPHHGSLTSSTPSFIATLSPQVVVFSSGYRNRFGHPAPAVLTRYAQINSTALITAHSGALTFVFSAAGLDSMQQQRQHRRRFWSAEQAGAGGWWPAYGAARGRGIW